MAATDDYIACRCCLLNGLFTGLRLGAEAVEKFLKAFILYCDPTFDVEAYGHNIRKIAAKAQIFEPRLETGHFRQVFKRLEAHYRNRYPNAADLKASTAELVEIDELVLHICDCLPIPEGPKFRNYGPFLLLCCNRLPPLQPYTKWLERNNLALKRAKPILLKRYEAVEKELGE